MQVQLNSKDAKELVLDTGAGLTIHSAALITPVGEQPLQFTFGEAHKVRVPALPSEGLTTCGPLHFCTAHHAGGEAAPAFFYLWRAPQGLGGNDLLSAECE